jgi:hypothetical protein
MERSIAAIKSSAPSMWERAGHHDDGTPNTLRVVLCRNGRVKLVDDRGHAIEYRDHGEAIRAMKAAADLS